MFFERFILVVIDNKIWYDQGKRQYFLREAHHSQILQFSSYKNKVFLFLRGKIQYIYQHQGYQEVIPYYWQYENFQVHCYESCSKCFISSYCYFHCYYWLHFINVFYFIKNCFVIRVLIYVIFFQQISLLWVYHYYRGMPGHLNFLLLLTLPRFIKI